MNVLSNSIGKILNVGYLTAKAIQFLNQINCKVVGNKGEKNSVD